MIDFGAVDAGQGLLDAVRRLPELVGRKKVRVDEVGRELVTGAWRRLVFEAPDVEPGCVDRYAYPFCLLEQLYRALRRRDIFAAISERWADPRAQLLSGEAWDRARPDVLTSLRLPEQPDAHLAELAADLNVTYLAVAGRLPENAALDVVVGGERIKLERYRAEPEPPSSAELRYLPWHFRGPPWSAETIGPRESLLDTPIQADLTSSEASRTE